MRRLALFYFLSFSYAKIINMPNLGGHNHDNSEYNKEHGNGDFKYYVWVLDLKSEDWDSIGLRKASEEELLELYDYVGPLIDEYESRPLTPIRVKKDDPEKPYPPWRTSNANKTSLDEMRQNILKLINKFDMYGKPDAIPDLADNNQCSITLYFYGLYTSVLTTSGEKQFHYFIPPPTPLPDWFYEEHSNSTSNEQQTFVKLPEDIKKDFYLALLRLLQLILSHSL